MRKDLILHGVIGLLIIPATALIYWIGTQFGVVYAIDAAGWMLAIGKELQDKFLKTGTPDPLDALTTGLATMIGAHALNFLGIL